MKNSYITIFVFILTAVVAIVLAYLSFGLKPIHDRNEAIYNKKAILSAIADYLGTDFAKITDDQVQEIFDSKIEQVAIDMEGNILSAEELKNSGYPSGKAEDIDLAQEKKKNLEDQVLPVFIFSRDDGGQFYILSVRGKGLWDEIWGNIALEEDLNTIAGVAFDHKGETPGLGAEIKDNPAWAGQFNGKKIYNETGDYVSVDVVKAGVPDDAPHAVDGITGATITADGVGEMLERGLQYYEPYFKSIN